MSPADPRHKLESHTGNPLLRQCREAFLITQRVHHAEQQLPLVKQGSGFGEGLTRQIHSHDNICAGTAGTGRTDQFCSRLLIGFIAEPGRATGSAFNHNINAALCQALYIFRISATRFSPA